jgi:hypothetical protein
MKTSSKLPVLKTTPMGGRTQIYYDSVLTAADIDPATESPDRPLTVTKVMAAKMLSLSPRTIDRMIAAGREAPTDNQAA